MKYGRIGLPSRYASTDEMIDMLYVQDGGHDDILCRKVLSLGDIVSAQHLAAVSASSDL